MFCMMTSLPWVYTVITSFSWQESSRVSTEGRAEWALKYISGNNYWQFLRKELPIIVFFFFLYLMWKKQKYKFLIFFFFLSAMEKN